MLTGRGWQCFGCTGLQRKVLRDKGLAYESENFWATIQAHDQNGRVSPPVFFGRFILRTAAFNVALKELLEQTVAGMGYDLVELERSAGGLLRVTIDFPWTVPAGGAAAVAGGERLVTVEDCEKVTRQLQFVLEVEAVDYRRLEVSSPGIDRPLRSQQDFERFVGEVIDVTLKQPLGADAQGQVSANRKKFRGVLERAPAAASNAAGTSWQVVWSNAPEPKPGVRVSKKRAPAAMQVLGFELSDLKEARLAPVVNFKGRRGANSADTEHV